MRLIKTLIILFLGLAVFGSGGYFTYVLLVQPRQLLRKELDAKAVTGPPTPPPDPSLPDFEACMKIKKSGDLVRAQAALEAFLENNPKSTVLAAAKTALGEVNTDIFFSAIPSPDKEQYVVQRGDALAKIERKLKTTAELIMRTNNLDDPRRLSIGQVLVISHPQFSLVINRREKTVTLLNKGNFFKQYPVKAWNAPVPKAGPPVSARVKEKMAWKNGQRVAFGSKDFAGSARSVSFTVPGCTLYTDPAEGGEPAPGGIALGAEDMEELSTLLGASVPVTME
jgi:LysM repeat protein